MTNNTQFLRNLITNGYNEGLLTGMILVDLSVQKVMKFCCKNLKQLNSQNQKLISLVTTFKSKYS